MESRKTSEKTSKKNPEYEFQVRIWKGIMDRGLFKKGLRVIYLSLQSINDVQRSDGLSLGMFSISDCITNNSLKEDFEDSSGFFVDEAGDTFNATTTSETTDRGFGDAL